MTEESEGEDDGISRHHLLWHSNGKDVCVGVYVSVYERVNIVCMYVQVCSAWETILEASDIEVIGCLCNLDL